MSRSSREAQKEDRKLVDHQERIKDAMRNVDGCSDEEKLKGGIVLIETTIGVMQAYALASIARSLLDISCRGFDIPLGDLRL